MIGIKGMTMPESCAVCRFNSRCDECICVPNYCLAVKENDYESNCIGYFRDSIREGENPEEGFTPTDRRQDWCPLVEVPTPHGRLIDADALIENANFYETEMEAKEAPTVIEAETDKENR